MVLWNSSDISHLAGVCVVYTEVPHVWYLRCHVQEHSQHFLQILHSFPYIHYCFWHGILLSIAKSSKYKFYMSCQMLDWPSSLN